MVGKVDGALKQEEVATKRARDLEEEAAQLRKENFRLQAALRDTEARAGARSEGLGFENEELRREVDRLKGQLKGRVRRPSRAPPPPKPTPPVAVEVQDFDFGKFAEPQGGRR